MTFTPEGLLPLLSSQLPPRRCVVAYSGGLDSHVLLHALCALRGRLPPIEIHALHVNHGLSPQANAWAAHCEAVCHALGIGCTTVTVDARAAAGKGPEAAARTARYQAFADHLGEGEWLLCAHHQDDQAETLLLQLLRGSGPRGLAAMPATTTFAAGRLLRPLLDFRRDQLHAYALTHGLSWIEDESNFDTAYERNYLRREIMPRLKQRWPGVPALLARSAGHCAEASLLLDELAGLDLAAAQDQEGDTLSVAVLLALGEARCRNLIRLWLRQQRLTVPSRPQLQQIVDGVVTAAWDATPCVTWPGGEVRRYRDRLYAMAPLVPHDVTQLIPWDLEHPLSLPTLGISLACTPIQGGGLQAQLAREGVTIRFRQGGEHCRPVGRSETHSLKHLFQEQGIPPWQRERIPLLYVGEQLALVVGYWCCEPFQVPAHEPGLLITVQGG